MAAESNKRKPRIPLSQEELFYYIQYKKLKQEEKLQAFKKTALYKIFNTLNVGLAALVTYISLSILLVCCWEENTILTVAYSFGKTNLDKMQREIIELQILTTDNKLYLINTYDLFELPKEQETILLGKDYIFKKAVKAKLQNNIHTYWTINSYATLTISAFALFISFFVYKLNRHLTANGLLTVFGLLFLSAVYFIFI
jgi:hypothetical protein